MTGSVRGELFVQTASSSQRKVGEPRRVNEFVMDSGRRTGPRISSRPSSHVLRLLERKNGAHRSYGPQKFFTKVKPDYRFNVKLVGLSVVQASNLMQTRSTSLEAESYSSRPRSPIDCSGAASIHP